MKGSFTVPPNCHLPGFLGYLPRAVFSRPMLPASPPGLDLILAAGESSSCCFTPGLSVLSGVQACPSPSQAPRRVVWQVESCYRNAILSCFGEQQSIGAGVPYAFNINLWKSRFMKLLRWEWPLRVYPVVNTRLLYLILGQRAAVRFPCPISPLPRLLIYRPFPSQSTSSLSFLPYQSQW